MRCKNGLVSTTSNRNLGCGEWDYSCNTYVTDSSLTDSVKATHPNYIISGFSGTSFNYAAGPTYDYYEYKNRIASASSLNDTLAPVNQGNSPISLPFSQVKSKSKTQWLFLQSELTAAGLSAGNLSALDLDLTQTGGAVGLLRIRMKASNLDNLSGIADSTGFVQVYFQNTSFSGIGLQRLQFYQPFAWNGTSNILVEISYSSPQGLSGNILKGGNLATGKAQSNTQDDYFLQVDGQSGQIDCGDINALDSTTQFTFEAWVNIKSWQNWSGIFKDNGKTVMETGDQVGALYCIIRNPTNTYGYATNVLPLNTWTHVAMVFDGSQTTNAGKLKLFINGVQKTLTFSGTIPDRTENNNTPLILARGVNCRIDDPRVWSKALASTQIATWFRKKVNASHPEFPSLEAAYDLDMAFGNILPDLSTNNRVGLLSGNYQRNWFTGHQIFKNLEPETERPNIQWVKNNPAIQVQNLTVMDSVEKMPNVAVQYALVNGQPKSIDTTVYYQAGNQIVWSETGQQVRNIVAASAGTINIQNLAYYSRTPQKIELLSFVTPYGIGIDFGMGGKVWEFDISDYATILRGWKRISMERGGENQEEIDLQFVFIEGTPPRKVLSAQQIWPVTHSSFADISANKVFEERAVPMLPQMVSAKLKSVVTGHGQEGEFIPRNHALNLNGGSAEFNWQVWKYCGDNPVYPQGGTWVYDRAGWCPGAPSDLQEWEVTTIVQPGQNHTFDYSVSTATGDSRYIASHQLIQYGPPTFSLDAALLQVKVPGQLSEFGRRNPACMHPEVMLRNNGSTPLTNLIFTYGLVGQTPYSYQWTGNLGFMKTELVTFPLNNLGESIGVFYVECTQPNNGTDGYLPNNRLESNYLLPLQMPQKFIVELKTNLNASENEYRILDAAGNEIHARNGLSPNTIYRDTVEFLPGCFSFHLTDEGNDGLNWWANTAQGTGYVRFRSAVNNAILKPFNADFGGEVYQQFLVSNVTSNQPVKEYPFDIQLFPNPAKVWIHLEIGLTHDDFLEMEIVDLLGKTLKKDQRFCQTADHWQIPVEMLSAGTYFIKVKSKEGQWVQKWIKE